MTHILLCPHALDYGGSQLGVYYWAGCLDRSRYRVSVLAMKKGGLSEKFEARFPVYYDDTGYPNIEEYIKRLKPDIVHCCPGGGSDLEYISKAARLVPVTQTVMCPREVSNYNDVAGSVVISKFVLSIQKRKERVVQIDLPLDTAGYDIRFDKGYFGLPKDKLIVGSFGNNRKENAHFLEIARYFKGDVHFVIRTDKRYGYFFGRKRITVLKDRLTEDEKMSLMKCFDIFLYPTSNEAYGMVFLEAMSQKVPIITYDDSANKEVADGGGLFAELNDKKGMMALLERLAKDPGERALLGERGYGIFKERNEPLKIAKRYEEFFETALKERGKA